jgi:parallel beta-helix repeat protein
LPASQALGGGTTTISCGMIVTTSIKAGNGLTNCPGDGLVIGAKKVNVNLNGHTIDGQDTGAGVDFNGYAEVTVQNGTNDFEDGILVSGQSGTVIRVTSTSNDRGFHIDAGGVGSKVDRSYSVDDTQGVGSFASGAQITRLGVVNALADGIFVTGSNSNVDDNTVVRYGLNGIEVDGPKSTVRNNDVSGTAVGSGIFLGGANGTLVSGNTITDAQQNGLDLTGSNLKITDNEISRTAGNDGINLSGNGATVSRNWVSDSAGNGVDLTGDGLTVADNQVSNSAGSDGIVASGSGSTFSGKSSPTRS